MDPILLEDNVEAEAAKLTVRLQAAAREVISFPRKECFFKGRL